MLCSSALLPTNLPAPQGLPHACDLALRWSSPYRVLQHLDFFQVPVKMFCQFFLSCLFKNNLLVMLVKVSFPILPLLL